MVLSVHSMCFMYEIAHRRWIKKATFCLTHRKINSLWNCAQLYAIHFHSRTVSFLLRHDWKFYERTQEELTTDLDKLLKLIRFLFSHLNFLLFLCWSSFEFRDSILLLLADQSLGIFSAHQMYKEHIGLTTKKTKRRRIKW